MELEWISDARITAPLGWSAGAVWAEMKTYGPEPRLDLGLLVSERPCSVAGVFTQNRVCGAPVVVTRERVARGVARGVVANSGCSNVALGERGLADARQMAAWAAARAGVAPAEHMLVASTGVIARPLPMDRIARGLQHLQLSAEGADAFSQAIMTTDTYPKVAAVRFEHAGTTYSLAGTAKGSGMCHPNMATVLCFLTTDIALPAPLLQDIVRRVADQTINMVDVDMDTSTSDMMLAFANGAALGPTAAAGSQLTQHFEETLLALCTRLAKELARDGEGARALVEVEVRGARALHDARLAARTVVSSPLVKAMVAGKDPNLGRVLMALGRSGEDLDLGRLRVWLGDHLAFDRGEPTDLELATISDQMAHETVRLTVDLGLGTHQATAWGCDLTEEYVRINADYTT